MNPTASRVFVDTNGLVYLRDARRPEKQARCAEWMSFLWESRGGRLSAELPLG